MSSENWKLKQDLCRCCLTEGNFKNLSEPCKSSGLLEIYSDMLKDCFNIEMVPVPGLLCAATYTICEICISRLREAIKFKKQVQICEERFRDMYNRNVFIVPEPSLGIDVKQELPDTYQDDVFREECSQDDNDDDDYDESLDFIINEQVHAPDPEENTRKKKKSKKTVKNVFREECSQDDNDDDDYDESLDFIINEQVHAPDPEENTRKKKKSKKTVKSKSYRRTKKKVKQEAEDVADNDGVKKKGSAYYTITQNQYKCNICAKIYASQPLVSQHYRFVHLKRRPKDRKCPKCDKRIPAHLRASHLEKEHGVPAPSCGVCGKKFRYPCNVIQHQKKVHMGEKTAVCDICQKSFFNQLSLRLHLSTHREEKRFKCSTCGREFRWENNLKDHLRIHTGEKRFVCSVCEKAFVQKSTLKQHAARNHPGVDVS